MTSNKWENPFRAEIDQAKAEIECDLNLVLELDPNAKDAYLARLKKDLHNLTVDINGIYMAKSDVSDEKTILFFALSEYLV